MYKTKTFKVRSLEDIYNDINSLSIYNDSRRVFLADGDALACNTDFLVKILKYLKKSFPKLQRVSSYASPYNLLQKSLDELKLLKENGLNLIYYGLESGNEKLLKYINKPMKQEKVVKALNKATNANIKTSVTVILGLGGKNLSKEHIEDSAKVINECLHINYLATLQLGLSNTKEDNFFKRFENKNQEFIFCSDEDMLEEQRRFITLINPKKSIIFRSNHTSNILPLKGTLPRNADDLLGILNMALEDKSLLRPNYFQGF